MHLLHPLFRNPMIDGLAIDLSSGGHKMCVCCACLLDKCFSPPLPAGFFFAAWHEQRAAAGQPVAFYPGRTRCLRTYSSRLESLLARLTSGCCVARRCKSPLGNALCTTVDISCSHARVMKRRLRRSKIDGAFLRRSGTAGAYNGGSLGVAATSLPLASSQIAQVAVCLA